jgi:hypothetical protein
MAVLSATFVAPNLFGAVKHNEKLVNT